MKYVLVGLDRDDTLTMDLGGWFGKEDDWKDHLKFCPYAVEGIKELNKDPRVRIVVVTNQHGVAYGYFTIERVEEVNDEIDRRLREKGAIVHNWQYCPYVTTQYVKEKGVYIDERWIRDNGLRKPGIEMLRRGARELGLNLEEITHKYVVGDRPDDVQMGLNAGGKGFFVRHGRNNKHYQRILEMMSEYEGRVFPVNNLFEAANRILEDINNFK